MKDNEFQFNYEHLLSFTNIRLMHKLSRFLKLTIQECDTKLRF